MPRLNWTPQERQDNPTYTENHTDDDNREHPDFFSKRVNCRSDPALLQGPSVSQSAISGHVRTVTLAYSYMASASQNPADAISAIDIFSPTRETLSFVNAVISSGELAYHIASRSLLNPG